MEEISWLNHLLGNPITWVTVIGGIGSVIWWGSATHIKTNSSLKFIDEIREDIKKIFGLLNTETKTSKSPWGLTELGEKVSADLKVKNWAKGIADDICDQVKWEAEFELYEFCEGYITNDYKLTEAQDIEIRKAAYNHGVKTEKILDVLIIELRDALLRLREENESNVATGDQ